MVVRSLSAVPLVLPFLFVVVHSNVRFVLWGGGGGGSSVAYGGAGGIATAVFQARPEEKWTISVGGAGESTGDGFNRNGGGSTHVTSELMGGKVVLGAGGGGGAQGNRKRQSGGGGGGTCNGYVGNRAEVRVSGNVRRAGAGDDPGYGGTYGGGGGGGSLPWPVNLDSGVPADGTVDVGTRAWDRSACPVFTAYLSRCRGSDCNRPSTSDLAQLCAEWKDPTTGCARAMAASFIQWGSFAATCGWKDACGGGSGSGLTTLSHGASANGAGGGSGSRPSDSHIGSGGGGASSHLGEITGTFEKFDAPGGWQPSSYSGRWQAELTDFSAAGSGGRAGGASAHSGVAVALDDETGRILAVFDHPGVVTVSAADLASGSLPPATPAPSPARRHGSTWLYVVLPCVTLTVLALGAIAYRKREKLRSCLSRGAENVAEGYEQLSSGVAMGVVVGS